MFEEYKKYVTIIKDRRKSLDERQNALRNLIVLYMAHVKQNMEEAFYYIKQSALHLFKLGVLRGITEDLRTLKVVWMKIMESITNTDMQKMGLKETDIYDFDKLLKKIKYECDINLSNKTYNMYMRETGNDIYTVK